MYKSTFAKNEHGKLKNVQQKQSSETNKKKKKFNKNAYVVASKLEMAHSFNVEKRRGRAAYGHRHTGEQ